MFYENCVFTKRHQKKIFTEADPGTLPNLKWSSLCFVTLVNGWKPLTVVAIISFGPGSVCGFGDRLFLRNMRKSKNSNTYLP